ncbi:MAG: baseplate J/gp47 family protein [Butyrivibrio sp.]|nr:baseplate J/gp47 family protein [Butyrivibrio sp.]
MLNVEDLKSRTYEERMEDVMRELPIRSSEWTNYNASDPGITIIENLTAFLALQGVEIANLNYRAKMALLKMAGFVPIRGKCARVLLSPDDIMETNVLMPGQRFRLGDLIFETNREVVVGNRRIEGVFSHDKEGFKDISYILDREISVPAMLFGEEPVKENSVYFIMNGDISDLHEIIFYIKMVENANRNRTVDRTEHIFADIKWECYTEKGFVKVSVRDFTSAFVNSGEIKVSLPDIKMTEYGETPISGYCIRATLTRAEYDIVPKITNIFGFLFEVWQKDTRSFSQLFGRNDSITVKSPIGEEVYYIIFGKEKKGSSYRRYELSTSGDRNGRFCLYEKNSDGSMTFTFSEQEFGYAPQKFKDSVRVILYNEEIMRKYNVGKVLGYDEQEISIPTKNIVHETFFLIARRRDEEGYLYDFVRPEKNEEGALYYHLLEGEGKIIIEDAGDFIDADLFMGSVAVTAGDRGNIRQGNILRLADNDSNLTFYNPGAATGGCFRENLDKVRERFVKDMRTPYRAVTASDYEKLALTTPGLCIKKAKAIMSENDNLVKLVLLPDSDERFPKLSNIYIERVTKRLEERRLITSRFMIIKPTFVSVGVKCTVYVKRHFTDCRKQIEEKLRSSLDYINSDHNFGDKIRFEDVFHGIEELPCVEYVYELSLYSENVALAQQREFDIYLRQDALSYPGEINLEIVSSDR